MSGLKAVMSGIDKVFEFIEKYVTAFSLIIFTFAIVANVVGRYVFQQSITWAEELSRYLNILMVYIAISAGIKTDAHIGVDAVQTLLLPKRFHKYMDALRFTITLVFCAIVTYLSFDLALSIKQSSPAMRLPMMIPYMVMPVGMCMASVRCIMRIIQSFTNPPVPDDDDEAEEAEEVATV